MMSPEAIAPAWRSKLLLLVAALVVLVALALLPHFVGLYQVQLFTYGLIAAIAAVVKK